PRRCNRVPLPRRVLLAGRFGMWARIGGGAASSGLCVSFRDRGRGAAYETVDRNSLRSVLRGPPGAAARGPLGCHAEASRAVQSVHRLGGAPPEPEATGSNPVSPR